MAKELGWEENKDYWLIYDACRTELEREGGRNCFIINIILIVEYIPTMRLILN